MVLVVAAVVVGSAASVVLQAVVAAALAAAPGAGGTDTEHTQIKQADACGTVNMPQEHLPLKFRTGDCINEHSML